MRSVLGKSGVVAGVAALVIAALFPLAGSAGAVGPVVTVAGSAPSTAVGPSIVTYSYTISTSAPLTSAVITTQQDSHLPAALTPVMFDNAAVPAGDITAVGSSDIAIDVAPSGLAAGTHLLTFTATVPSGAAATTSSSVSLLYDDGVNPPQTITSAAVPVAINQPDLSVVFTPDSGETASSVGPLGTGRVGELGVDVANLGYGTPLSSLLITFPNGAAPVDNEIQDVDENPLPCVSVTGRPDQRRCPLGVIGHTAGAATSYLVPVTTIAHPPIGQTLPLTVAVIVDDATQGTDTNPTNDSLQFPIHFTGTANLSYALTPTKAKVAIGATTTVTLKVHNAGPNTASATLGLIYLQSTHFTVVKFSGKVLSLDASQASHRKVSTGFSVPQVSLPGRASSSPVIPAVLAKSAAAQTLGDITDGVLWDVGDLAPGQSLSATITLKAKSVGTAGLGLLAISDAADENCTDDNCPLVPLELQAVTPPTKVTTVSSGSTQDDSNQALANTGTASGPLLGIAVGLLSAGAGFLLLSRRRDHRQVG